MNHCGSAPLHLRAQNLQRLDDVLLHGADANVHLLSHLSITLVVEETLLQHVARAVRQLVKQSHHRGDEPFVFLPLVVPHLHPVELQVKGDVAVGGDLSAHVVDAFVVNERVDVVFKSFGWNLLYAVPGLFERIADNVAASLLILHQAQGVVEECGVMFAEEPLKVSLFAHNMSAKV